MASKALMELRVAMCQTGAGSAGVRYLRACTPPLALFRLFSRTSRRPANSSRFAPRREFLAKNYAAVKAACPKVPILVRESSGTPAKLTGVYGAQSLAPSRSRSPFFFRTFSPRPSFLKPSSSPSLRASASPHSSASSPRGACLTITCRARSSFAPSAPPPVLPSSEFGVEKTVDVEGMSADAFKSQLDAVMKGS